MRFRKIKNLEARRSQCDSLRIPYELSSFDYRTQKENPNYLSPAEIFGRNAPLEMEIGCGKGQFICEYAKKHPEKNLIAVECVQGVLVEACEKAIEYGVENVRFLEMKAEYLPLFIENGSLDCIFLNFSTPYPKNRHESRRLTSPAFLEIYKALLKDGGKLLQKTDSEAFFDYSVNSLKENGFKIEYLTRDLYSENDRENIPTEYEQRFVGLGMPIYKLTAVKE